MDHVWMVCSLMLVSVLWGITNPLMKRYSIGLESVQAETYIWQTLREMRFLASRPKYVASFLLNQTGSVLFVSSLAAADLSLAVPLTNGLTFLITTVVGQMMGEEGLGKEGWLGVAMLCTGVGCCIAGKAS